MPFDTATVTAEPTDRPDPLAEQRAELTLYAERRAAATALWARVPPRQFDLRAWVHPCRTVACAIGWLAVREHDGWELRPSINVIGSCVPAHRRTRAELARAGLPVGDSFLEIGLYFGLHVDEARAVFGSEHAYVAAGITVGLPVRPEHVATLVSGLPVRRRAEVLSRYEGELRRPPSPGVVTCSPLGPTLSLDLPVMALLAAPAPEDQGATR